MPFFRGKMIIFVKNPMQTPAVTHGKSTLLRRHAQAFDIGTADKAHAEPLVERFLHGREVAGGKVCNFFHIKFANTGNLPYLCTCKHGYFYQVYDTSRDGAVGSSSGS